MANIEEALKTAGAESDLQTILRVLEDRNVGFNRQEAAAGPFANMDTALLAGLNVRMLSVIKRAQQQQQHIEQSDYFISPQTQEQVASAVFMIEEQSHATQDSDGVGMGVFFEPRRAVTADHNFPGEWQIGTHVVISFPETGVKSHVTLAKRRAELDFAILEAAEDHPFTALTDSSNLRGTQLVLASFRIGIAEYAPMFDRRLGFCPASGVTTSPHGHHLFYICTTFAGDSGAALLLKDGKLVGIHLEIANAARERLERMKTDLSGRLGQVEESLDALVSGGFGQGAVAILGNAFGA